MLEKKWMVFKYEKFGEASGTLARHSPSTVTQSFLLGLGLAFIWFLLWALCLSDIEVQMTSLF